MKTRISKQTGINSRTLYDIQKGGAVPKEPTLRLLAAFFKLPETYFLGTDTETAKAGDVVRIVPVQLEFNKDDDFTESEIAVMVDMTKQFFHTQKQIIKDLRKKMNKRS